MRDRLPAARAAAVVCAALALTSLSPTSSGAQTETPTGSAARPLVLQHLVPAGAAADEPLELQVTVIPAGAALQVEVHVRRAGDALYATIPLRQEQGVFRGVVPATYAGGERVEYYVRARARDGSVITLPDLSPEERPFSVPVASQDPTIIVLTPSPDETGVDPMAQIAVLFDPPLDTLETARLSLDGTEIRAERSPLNDYLSAVPAMPLASGRHTARVEITEPHATTPRVRTWSFTVQGEEVADEGTIRGVSGRVSVGVEVASGEDASDEVEAYLSEPPGTHIVAEGDLAGTVAGQPVSAWIASTPGFSPRTQGAVLVSSDAAVWELGTLAPVVSDLALSGPVATGGRIALRPAGARATAYALFVPRNDEIFRYATWLGAVSAAAGPPIAQVSALGVYALEDGTPAMPEGTIGVARRGFTIAPRLTVGPPAVRLDAQLAVSRAIPRGLGPAESSLTRTAAQVELAIGHARGRASLRYTGVPRGYAALGAPYIDDGRREGYAYATFGRAPGVVVSGSYRVARHDSTAAASIVWTHTADGAVSYLTRSGSGATITAGRFDQSSYAGISGVLVAPGRRISANLTQSSAMTTRTLAGSLDWRISATRRVNLEGGLLASRMTDEVIGSDGMPTGERRLATSELTPRLLVSWRFRPREALEVLGSLSFRKVRLIATGQTDEPTDVRQEIARVAYVRAW